MLNSTLIVSQYKTHTHTYQIFYNFLQAHSSPPLLSAEKIMAGFRARNHIIADRIEEEDEVDHRLFIADGNDLENDTQEAAGDRSDRSVNSRKKENY